MKVYSDHPMSSPVEARTLRSTEVTRLPSPASVLEMSAATSKSVRSGIGALHVWRASQCRRTSVGIECHRFTSGGHRITSLPSKRNGANATHHIRSGRARSMNEARDGKCRTSTRRTPSRSVCEPALDNWRASLSSAAWSIC